MNKNLTWFFVVVAAAVIVEAGYWWSRAYEPELIGESKDIPEQPDPLNPGEREEADPLPTATASSSKHDTEYLTSTATEATLTERQEIAIVAPQLLEHLQVFLGAGIPEEKLHPLITKLQDGAYKHAYEDLLSASFTAEEQKALRSIYDNPVMQKFHSTYTNPKPTVAKEISDEERKKWQPLIEQSKLATYEHKRAVMLLNHVRALGGTEPLPEEAAPSSINAITDGLIIKLSAASLDAEQTKQVTEMLVNPLVKRDREVQLQALEKVID